MFLVRHAEALLLVHDEQAEILELHVLAQELVRADDKVALSRSEVCEQSCRLRAGLEAAQYADVHREAEEPLQRRLIMLLGKHCRRHKYRRLLAVEHAFHHRAHCDLGLAEANVPAQQSVHRHGGLHVPLYLRRAAQLIVRLRVAEVLLELALPLAVRRKGVPRQALALGIKGDELFRHVLRGALCAAAGLHPIAAAHL